MIADDPLKKSRVDESRSESATESGIDSEIDNNSTSETVRPKEVGGRGGLDPTRYGDWEKSGRCIDF